MKWNKFLCLSLLLALPFCAQAQDWQKERQIYRKIDELASIAQGFPASKQNALTLIEQMLPQLEDYPLLADAEYKWLEKKLPNVSFEELQDFQRRFPHYPAFNELQKAWLTWRYSEKDWRGILQHAEQLAPTQNNQCLIAFAQWEQAKTDEKSTAVLPQQMLEKLWLTPKEFPLFCDLLSIEWERSPSFKPELTRERAILLFENNQVSALSYLQQKVLDVKTAALAEIMNALFKSPKALKNYPQFFSPEDADPDPIYGRILNAILPKYIKTLKADADWQYRQDFAQFEQWAAFWQLPQNQLDHWKQAYLSHFFDQQDEEFQTWRDEQLRLLKNDKLSERRIRMAIREKQDLRPWLNLLSAQARQKEEWQYWQAQYLQGEEKQKALQNLSRKRSFYGVLAASKLNIAYQPEMDELKKSTSNLGETNAPNAKSAVQISELFAPQLARVAEWRHFNADEQVNQEWNALLKQASFKQKLQLADYAIQQNWYDLAVEATIQAKAWSYLSLRLPNAYPEWFDLHLKGKKIHRTFAMAIARQESAWRPKARSHANARGLMQLLPTTAEQTAQKTHQPYNYDNPRYLYDPFYNIMLGTAHLQQLYDKYGDNRILIAAAYNAGASRVDKWLANSNGKLSMAEFVASIPFLETRNYVQNVIAYDAYYQILQQQPQLLFSQAEKDRLY